MDINNAVLGQLSGSGAAAFNRANAVSDVALEESGFSGLTAESFMKLLITELQNQDPLEPVGNEQLLSQLSMMRNLQSNIELSDTLKSITSSQQLTSAAALIGKSATGRNTLGNEVSGIVEKAFIRDGGTFLVVAGEEVSMNDVTSVDLPAAGEPTTE